MPYTISEALTSIPGFKKKYYYDRGRERVVVGEERWLDFNRISPAYNDTWFGKERLRCKCLKTYKNGATFEVVGKRSISTVFLNWWEVMKVVN